MYIQCFIEKVDGSPVFVDYEGVRYIFQKNEFGDHVCFVGNQAHQRRLLKMGPVNYIEYQAPEEANQTSVLGSAPIPLGGKQKQAPPPPLPLPDNLTVDDSLSQPPGDINNPAAGATIEPEAPSGLAASDTVDWVDSAKEAKVGEFKYLGGDKFKVYVDKNRDDVSGWPLDVQAELAKKLINLFPDEDPGIEGFDLNDFDG